MKRLLVVVAAVCCAGLLNAKTCTWIGGSGSWSVAGNWDENGKPETGDSVVLSVSSAAEIVNDLGAMSLSDITFEGSQAITLKSEGALTLSGVSFAWSGQTLFRLMQDNCTAAVTVDAPIVLTHPGRTNQVAMAGSATTLTLKGDISGGGGIWFSGNSSSNNKARLSGNNSYVGETIFSYDSLYGDSTTAFGQAGNMIKHINGGSGYLNLTVPGTYNYGYTPHTEPGTALGFSGSGEYTWAGPIVLTSATKTYSISIPASITKATFSGAISGLGKLKYAASASTGTSVCVNGDNSHGGTLFQNCKIYLNHTNAVGCAGTELAYVGGSGAIYLVPGTWNCDIKFGTTSYQGIDLSSANCVINGKIYADDDSTFGQVTVRGGGNLYVRDGVHFPGQKGFYPLLLNSAVVHLQSASEIGYFYKTGGTDWNGFVQFDAPGNTYGALNLGRTVNVKCGVADALDATKTILWAGNTSAGGGTLDVNGWDQHALALESDLDTTGRNIVSGGRAATVFLDGATQDYTTYAKIKGGVSLVWNPSGKYVQTVMNQDHTTAGAITVSNGIFRVGGTSTFKNLTAIDIADGATFDLATSASYALMGLKSLTVEDGGTFTTTADGPIGEDAVVTLGETATLALPQDATVTVAELWVYEDGEPKQLPKGDYDHSKVPQITGGKLSVAAGDPPMDEITWSAGAGEDKSVFAWANWDGEEHDLASGWVYPTFASAGTEAVVDSDVKFKGIAFDGAAKEFTLSGTGKVGLLDFGITVAAARTNVLSAPISISGFKGVANEAWTVGEDARLEVRAPISSTEPIAFGVGGKGMLDLCSPNDFIGSFTQTGGVLNVYAPSNAFGKAGASGFDTLLINERAADYVACRFYGTVVDRPMNVWGNSDKFGAFCFWEGTNVFNGKLSFAYTTRPRFRNKAVAICTGGLYSGNYLTPASIDGYACAWIIRNKPMECREGLELSNYITIRLETTGNTVGQGVSPLTFGGPQVFLDFGIDYAFDQSNLEVSFNAKADRCKILLNGHSQRIGTLTAYAGSTGVIDSPTPATLHVAGQRSDQALTGVEFTGFASLSKAGASTLTIDRKMSSQGTVEVTEGTLAFTANGSWRKCAELSISGTGVVSVPAGSVLRVKKIVIDGVEKLGTVGPVGSGADFETEHVTGGLIQGKTGALLLVR